jgi:hypothetical protein
MLTEVLVSLLRDDVAATSQRRVAARILVDHSAISRWMAGGRELSGDAVDALVDLYGFTTIARRARALYAVARTAGSSGNPALAVP